MTTQTFLRARQLTQRLGIARSTLHAWTKAQQFPQPVRLSAGVVAWRVADVEAWEQSRQGVKS